MGTNNLTVTDAAVIGGVAGATLGMIVALGLILFILFVIASWRIFKKAGEPGWKALIPIYNTYIMFKIVNMKNWFWWILGLSVVGSIVASINNSANFYYMSGVEVQTTSISEVPAIVIATMLIEAIIAIWTGIVYAYRTSKVFGHGIGYTIGLIFLPNLFWLILGFGKSKYDKKALKK